MRFLDVGVLLCVALKQPKVHYIGCKRLLGRLKIVPGSKPEEIVATTLLAPAVFYFILENRESLQKSRITAAVKALRSLNIKILPLENGEILDRASTVAEKYDLDFDDAVNAVVMQENGISEIYALDKDYDKLAWVRRIVP